MVATQQYVSLVTPQDGSDLDDAPFWETKPSTGHFLFYTKATPALGNGIPGAYHKPTTTLPASDINIPRCFGTGGGKIVESEVTVAIDFEISTTTAWPSTNNNKILAAVIARASGSDWNNDYWYEAGLKTIDSQTNAILYIMKHTPGASTVVASVNIGTYAYFTLPGYLSPSPSNIFTRIDLTVRSIDIHTASLYLVVQPHDNNGTYYNPVTLNYYDASSPILNYGYGGFAASGHAASSGVLWVHFQGFVLNADGVPFQSKVADPVEPPALETDPTLSQVALSPEYYSLSPESLPIDPDFGIITDVPWTADEFVTEQGYVNTTARDFTVRQVWQLKWSGLTTAEMILLRDFWTSHFSGFIEFTYQHPDETLPFTMVFDPSPAWPAMEIGPGIWEVSIRTFEIIVPTD